jgi:hypothetical protein
MEVSQYVIQRFTKVEHQNEDHYTSLQFTSLRRTSYCIARDLWTLKSTLYPSYNHKETLKHVSTGENTSAIYIL